MKRNISYFSFSLGLIIILLVSCEKEIPIPTEFTLNNKYDTLQKGSIAGIIVLNKTTLTNWGYNSNNSDELVLKIKIGYFDSKPNGQYPYHWIYFKYDGKLNTYNMTAIRQGYTWKMNDAELYIEILHLENNQVGYNLTFKELNPGTMTMAFWLYNSGFTATPPTGIVTKEITVNNGMVSTFGVINLSNQFN